MWSGPVFFTVELQSEAMKRDCALGVIAGPRARAGPGRAGPGPCRAGAGQGGEAPGRAVIARCRYRRQEKFDIGARTPNVHYTLHTRPPTSFFSRFVDVK